MKELQWKRGPKPYQIQYGTWKEFSACLPFEISFLKNHRLLWYSEGVRGIKILFADESKDDPFNELVEILILDKSAAAQISEWVGKILKKQWAEVLELGSA